MKYALMTLIVFLLFSCSGKNLPEKDLAFYEIKGKVNHLTIRHYHAVEKDGEIVRGERNNDGESDQTVTFDKKGYITQAYFYGEADSLDTKIVRDYNEDHLCIGETRYDADGEILSEWIWLYDENNNNTERLLVLDDGTFFTSWLLYYDDNNRLFARKSYRSPESVLFDSLYWVLDERGRQILEQNYGYYGYYGFNKVEYEGNSDLPGTIYVYDSYDELSHIIGIDYNDDDLITKAERFNADTVLVTSVSFDYTYDNRGNWISKIQYLDGEPVLFEERRIVYY